MRSLNIAFIRSQKLERSSCKENAVPELCTSCNSSKENYLGDAFYRYLGGAGEPEYFI